MTHRKPYRTLDGSIVTELLRPEDGARRMSLAIARLDEGQSTRPHLHRTSDEIYYIQRGEGVVYVGGKGHRVKAGDFLYIAAGTVHWVVAVTGPMEILCICSPPYRHEDTELTEGTQA